MPYFSLKSEKNMRKMFIANILTNNYYAKRKVSLVLEKLTEMKKNHCQREIVLLRKQKQKQSVQFVLLFTLVFHLFTKC